MTDFVDNGEGYNFETKRINVSYTCVHDQTKSHDYIIIEQQQQQR